MTIWKSHPKNNIILSEEIILDDLDFHFRGYK